MELSKEIFKFKTLLYVCLTDKCIDDDIAKISEEMIETTYMIYTLME